MNHPPLQRLLPDALRRHVLHFEATIAGAVAEFAASLPSGCRVLDAGAGEGQYASRFTNQYYVGVDLGIGDPAWNYGRLDVMADLTSLPFRRGSFTAALNIVTLEHVTDPAAVIEELYRVLGAGGSLLLVAPLEWEEHQQPHDYFRYTRFGLEHLLRKSGFAELSIRPVGGYFRLLARRLLNGLQFFPLPLAALAGLVIAVPALVLPFFDGLDKTQHFTLGFICTARKP